MRMGHDTCAMLTEAGFAAGWIEDIEEGDEVAFGVDWPSAGPPHFFVVQRVKKIPRYERDQFGHLLDENPNYLVQFIALYEDGTQRPMSYGAGWDCFIKRGESTGRPSTSTTSETKGDA